jgi:hypothetical protein
MSKRFTDTMKWDDPWFSGLAPIEKLFWIYLCDKCDHAGIWKVNLPLAKFFLGADFIASPGVFGDRVVILCEEKWFIKKFVDFQYGELTKDSRVHASVIKALEKEGVSIEYLKATRSIKDKDKDKDKDSYQEERGSGGEATLGHLVAGFDRFWAAYPNKKGKVVASKAWMKLCPDPELTEKIMASVMAHRASDQWTKDGGQFIPHPATWLNQRRWEDELKPAVKSSRVSAGAAPVPGKYDHLER